MPSGGGGRVVPYSGKVLFLDIDGVLNGHEKHPDSPYTTIRPDCVQRLNRVLKETGCNLVISSAWRYMLLKTKIHKKPAMTLLGFQYMLHTHGVVFNANGSAVIGFTCADEAIPDRGPQILDWLAAEGGKVESWAVVDDDPMEIELGEHAGRLVRTDGRYGLQKRDEKKLIQLLNER